MGEDQNRPSSATFIVEPSTRHTHSFILLHGLGSNGEKFGRELIESGVCSDGRTLPEIFPGARFIFPTSKRRRSSAFGRAMLTQWFDIASLDDPSHRSHKQVKGLQESSREILDLVDQESAKVPRENIILGGISQGCAMGLVCLLAMESPVGRFVGMSGWLPFRHEIDPIMGLDEDESESNEHGTDQDDDDIFGCADTDDPSATPSKPSGDEQKPVVKVLARVRDLLSLDSTESPCTDKSALTTPIFLGHGEADEKIRHSLGVGAHRTLTSLGFQASLRSYKGLGHWYKIPDEIDDIVAFIQHGASLPAAGES
ncbi:Alpha/Beta hydrolase protein [Chaetomium strumarium]|uniref:Alpha/Beta hydrolase protein n=1 Tax=Chaetomium strumarium TaxID=1170767 RepID=A0AAJ0GN23_9PEZI|nr:Alpha/Beta hydrolase protein [Chaetomium strumarium]